MDYRGGHRRSQRGGGSGEVGAMSALSFQWLWVFENITLPIDLFFCFPLENLSLEIWSWISTVQSLNCSYKEVQLCEVNSGRKSTSDCELTAEGEVDKCAIWMWLEVWPILHFYNTPENSRLWLNVEIQDGFCHIQQSQFLPSRGSFKHSHTCITKHTHTHTHIQMLYS